MFPSALSLLQLSHYNLRGHVWVHPGEWGWQYLLRRDALTIKEST